MILNVKIAVTLNDKTDENNIIINLEFRIPDANGKSCFSESK